MRYHEIVAEDAISHWFAGSKVVDANGHPKRMYHGTGAGRIDSFDPDRASETALYGPGIYFTDSPEVAGGTGGGRDEEMINAKADWNVAGYAFQGRKYELNKPFTKTEMVRILKRLDGPERRDARQDIGMRQSFNAVMRAFLPWYEGYQAEAQAKTSKDKPAMQAAQQAMQKAEVDFRNFLITNRGLGLTGSLLKFVKAEPRRITAPTVYPVYLSIKNPYEMEQAVTLDHFRALWDAASHGRYETFENATAGFRPPYRHGNAPLRGSEAWGWLADRVLGGEQNNGKAKANAVLKSMGYDGIHHEGGQIIATFGKHEVWIAFSPQQVKSVFAQRFDPASPNLSETTQESN